MDGRTARICAGRMAPGHTANPIWFGRLQRLPRRELFGRGEKPVLSLQGGRLTLVGSRRPVETGSEVKRPQPTGGPLPPRDRDSPFR